MFNEPIFSLTTTDLASINIFFIVVIAILLILCCLFLLWYLTVAKKQLHEIEELHQEAKQSLKGIQESIKDRSQKMQDEMIGLKSLKSQYEQYLERHKVILSQLNEIRVKK